MLVVAAFIQHIIFKVEEKDAKVKEVALKHCILHLNVSEMALGCGR